MFETAQSAVGVDDHSDCVEADPSGTRPGWFLIREPGGRRAAHPRSLARAQSRQRILVRADRRLARTDAAGLDLGEEQGLAVVGNQVDLAVARARIARERRKAELTQVGSRKGLPDATECAAGVLSPAGVIGTRDLG